MKSEGKEADPHIREQVWTTWVIVLHQIKSNMFSLQFHLDL